MAHWKGAFRSPRIFFHVGPHKTGTTSIQFAFLQSKNVNYPTPAESGPGHAELAWRAMGLNGRKAEPTLLRDVANQYRETNRAPLVFSSEEFSRVVLTGPCKEGLADLAKQFPVELIVTLTPMLERLISELQEGVKNKQSVQFNDVDHIKLFMDRRPGLRDNFLQELFSVADWTKINVVLVSKNKPKLLFDSISRIINRAIETPDTMMINRRIPYAQVELLKLIQNFIPKASHIAIQEAASNAYKEIDRLLPELSHIPYPPLPDEIVSLVYSRWHHQLRLIHELNDVGKIVLYE